MYINIEKDKISLIRSFLDKVRFHTVFKMLKYEDYYFNPSIFPIHIKRMEGLPERLKLLFKLIVLSENVSLSEFCSFFGEGIVQCLVSCNLFSIRGNELISKGYSIISCFDLYLLSESKNILPAFKINDSNLVNIYLGNDSYRLGNAIISHKPFGQVLDLCSGSGIQALISLKSSEKATVVEINEKAIPAIRFNSILNGLDERIHIINSSLYNGIGSENKYDVIIANPPFFAIPHGVKFPLCGDGGYDGMDIVRKILGGFENRLNNQGSFLMVLEAIGDEKSPFIIDEIRQQVKGKGYETMIFYHYICPKDALVDYFSFLMELVNHELNKQEIAEIMKKHYTKLGVQYSYSTTVVINKVEYAKDEYFQEFKLFKGRQK